MNVRKWFVQDKSTQNISIEKPSHILFFVGFLLSPILLLLYVAFAIFKEGVRIYLLLNLKQKFNGFVRTNDALWGIEGKGWKNIVPIVFMVKSDKEVDILNIVRKRLKERVFDKPKDYRKLTSTHHTFLGYVYLEHDTYKLDQCVTKIRHPESTSKYLETKDLRAMIQKYAESPLPLNNTALWEVMVSPVPFYKQEYNGNNYYVYPLLMKFNHMVCDGAALMALGSKIFADFPNQFQQLDELVREKAKNKQKVKISSGQNLRKIFEKTCHNLWIVYIFLGYVIYELFLRKKDKSALHGPPLSGEKHFVWIDENEEKLVSLAKKIKNNVPNATFSDVVFTAISVSLTSYLKDKKKNVPDTFYSAIPFVVPLENIENAGPAILENNFGMAFTHIPYQNKSLSRTLYAVRDQFALLKQNPEQTDVYYFLMNMVVKPFPLPLLTSLILRGLTCVISSVPCGERANVFDGLELDGGVVFTLNRWNTGITFAVITYDNRFHVGLLVDTQLVSNRSDAQKIVDNFFVNLKLLNEEIVESHEIKVK